MYVLGVLVVHTYPRVSFITIQRSQHSVSAECTSMSSTVSLTTSFFSVRATKSTADSFSLGTAALQWLVEPLKKEVLSETVEQQQNRKKKARTQEGRKEGRQKRRTRATSATKCSISFKTPSTKLSIILVQKMLHMCRRSLFEERVLLREQSSNDKKKGRFL